MAYYQYTVKYLCGDGDGAILGPGRYRTAINIHNPHPFPQQPVCWKVLSPRPDGAPTEPGPWQRPRRPDLPNLPPGSLPADWSMEINCPLINQFNQGRPTGFVVIHSPNELDVVVVYTVERLDQPAVQLEIETIAPRIIQTDQEMCPGE
jgi:hypothetical protein